MKNIFNQKINIESKIFFFYSLCFFLFLFPSCTNTSQMANVPLATNTPSFPLPMTTATPIEIQNLTQERIQEELVVLYKIDPSCWVDLLDESGMYQHTNEDFQLKETNIEFDPERYWIMEKATNASNTFLSFIACDENPCHPKVYIQDLKTGDTKEFDWVGWVPGRLMIHIIWFNDEVFSFYESLGPGGGQVIAYNIEDEEIVFYWNVYNCEKTTPHPRALNFQNRHTIKTSAQLLPFFHFTLPANHSYFIFFKT